MKVLSVASECAPLVKTGGLADVVGALPGALARQDVDMRVLLPGYPAVKKAVKGRAVAKWKDLMGGPARLVETTVEGVPLLILEAVHLYEREGGIYLDETGGDWPDNPQRFAALCRAAADICAGCLDWVPDVAHGHDWQGGWLPYYLHRDGTKTPSILTIHNIAFGGLAGAELIPELGLDPDDFEADGYEFWGRISALKAGLFYATRISTVSPTYATELTTPQFGMGFDGLISAREGDLVGILNGIDTDVWDPATDKHSERFKTLEGKAVATDALRETFGLAPSDGPLAVVVSRLTGQKGLDLLLDALPAFMDAGGQLALLGSGDPDLETAWRSAAERHDGLGVRIGYDEALSHKMMAGGEAVLVPSRFEPCGLTQLYGLRYGAIPVVARTGGLADTVIDANDAALKAGVATGIEHAPDDIDAMVRALIRLTELRRSEMWKTIVANAMRHPVGWDVSAGQYADLYRTLAPPK